MPLCCIQLDSLKRSRNKQIWRFGLRASCSACYLVAVCLSLWISGCATVVPPGTSSNNATISSGALTANSSSINFGSVAVGSNASQSLVLTNMGSTAITISQLTISNGAFSLSNVTLPISVGPGQNATATLQFTPKVAGPVTGNLTVVNSASSAVDVSLAGTGTQAQISLIPSSVSFGAVAVGTSNSQTINVINQGSSSLTLTQAGVSGVGFKISGITVPTTITAGASTTFNAVFGPTSTGNMSGSISLTSDASSSPLSVPLSGTGISTALVLTPTPNSVAFGNVPLNSTSSQSVTLTNTGNSNINISQVSASGPGYSTSGVAPNTTLTPGQSVTLTVNLTPTSTGTTTGSVTIVSNASNSPGVVTLAGESHSVALTWTASSSVVVGYNIYRGTTNGGPYSLQLDQSPISGTSFTDVTVQAGQTYYYVVTAVESGGTESVYSNQASASIP